MSQAALSCDSGAYPCATYQTVTVYSNGLIGSWSLAQVWQEGFLYVLVHTIGWQPKHVVSDVSTAGTTHNIAVSDVYQTGRSIVH
jgi:hypothetical protein